MVGYTSFISVKFIINLCIYIHVFFFLESQLLNFYQHTIDPTPRVWLNWSGEGPWYGDFYNISQVNPMCSQCWEWLASRKDQSAGSSTPLRFHSSWLERLLEPDQGGSRCEHEGDNWTHLTGLTFFQVLRTKFLGAMFPQSPRHATSTLFCKVTHYNFTKRPFSSPVSYQHLTHPPHFSLDIPSSLRTSPVMTNSFISPYPCKPCWENPDSLWAALCPAKYCFQTSNPATSGLCDTVLANVT